MKRSSVCGLAAMLLAATMIVPPASGLDLLGLATVNEQNGGSVADITLGGGPLADVQLLPGRNGWSLAGARVAAGNGGALSVDANIGRGVNAGIGVGGSSGLFDVTIGVGGGGNSGGGGGGNPGSNGNGGGIGLASTGGGNGDASCAGPNSAQALRLYQQTSLSGWQRASNIEIVPLRLCPEDRQQLSQLLRGQQFYQQLRMAVMEDALINAALSRTSYDAGRVVGVGRSGARLTVYVY